MYNKDSIIYPSSHDKASQNNISQLKPPTAYL